MKKVYLIFAILFCFSLVACEESQNTKSNPDATKVTEQKNNVSTDSKEKEVNEETSTVGNENSNEKTNLVKETSYSTEQEAINAIENYYKVEYTNLDLGHEIMASRDGAAGHQYIIWNEGKWLIELNFPTDPEYAIKEYESAEALAKEIVAYLEEHFLPAPDERGKIQIDGWREHPETIIQWQKGNKVYEIQQNTSNPIEVLKLAVEYGKEK